MTTRHCGHSRWLHNSLSVIFRQVRWNACATERGGLFPNQQLVGLCQRELKGNMILVRDPARLIVGRAVVQILDIKSAFGRICRSALVWENENSTEYRVSPKIQGIEERSESVVLFVRNLDRTAVRFRCLTNSRPCKATLLRKLESLCHIPKHLHYKDKVSHLTQSSSFDKCFPPHSYT